MSATGTLATLQKIAVEKQIPLHKKTYQKSNKVGREY
jgi:hypothetical protein